MLTRRISLTTAGVLFVSLTILMLGWTLQAGRSEIARPSSRTVRNTDVTGTQSTPGASVTWRPTQFPAPANHQHTRASIDGAIHPELIPESVAYYMFFRTMTILSDGSQGEEAKRRSRVRQTLRAADALARGVKPLDPGRTTAIGDEVDDHTREPIEQDVDRVVAFMAAYDRQLRQRNWQLVAQIQAAMPQQLSSELSEKLDRYVKLEHKRRIIIFADK